MIDLDRITWFQQWEFWLYYRLLRPAEFFNSWRWYNLLVPDQLWLAMGLYRLLKGLYHPGAALPPDSSSTSSTPPSRMQLLWTLCRVDPVIFVAWGLTFIAEPASRLFVTYNAAGGGGGINDIEYDDDEEGDDTTDEMRVDVSSGDARIASEEERQQQSGSDTNSSTDSFVSLPRSSLSPCRKCHKIGTDDPGYILIPCGHYPYCQFCITSSIDSTGGFVCPQCEKYCMGRSQSTTTTTTRTRSGILSWLLPKWLITTAGTVKQQQDQQTTVPSTPAKDIIRLASPELCKNAKKVCPVCQERPGNLILMPCGHLGFCGVCVAAFKQRCPYCRKGISRVVRGYDTRTTDDDDDE